MKWLSTKHNGIRYREHPTRKHGVRADRYYTIRLRVDGKLVEESLGWESTWKASHPEGTIGLEQEALARRAKILKAKHEGTGPRTLREQRAENEAEREAKKARIEADEKARMTFSQVWGQYIEQCRIDGKKSIRREMDLFRLWISPVVGDRPLAEIAPIHLERIKKVMADAGLAARTVHYCLAVVRQAFNYASRHGLFTGENPVRKVKKPTADNRRIRFLTQDEAEALLDEIKNRSRDTWIITMISFHCGLRFGEIAGLSWGDVDMERNHLCIRDPKNSRTRFVPMTDQIREAIGEIVPGNASDLIFPARHGGKRNAISDAFDRSVAALGLNAGIDDPRQKVCFHTCRHTYASWLVMSGVDLLAVKKLLGHQTVAMTERYSHLQPDTLQRAVNGLSKILASREQGGKVVRLRGGTDERTR